MGRDNDFLCHCWEMDISPLDPETFLARVRTDNPGLFIQVFGGKRPRGSVVEMIVAQTLMGMRSGSILADRPELDMLLRLAGTRQIGEAFLRLGYKSGGGKTLFMVAASEGQGREMNRLRDAMSKDHRFVEIEKMPLTEDDLLAVERAALLAVRL